MNASPKLQRAGRAFLLRLVAENGTEQAARVLRDLAAELEGLAADSDEGFPYFDGGTTDGTTKR